MSLRPVPRKQSVAGYETAKKKLSLRESSSAPPRPRAAMVRSKTLSSTLLEGTAEERYAKPLKHGMLSPLPGSRTGPINPRPPVGAWDASQAATPPPPVPDAQEMEPTHEVSQAYVSFTESLDLDAR